METETAAESTPHRPRSKSRSKRASTGKSYAHARRTPALYKQLKFGNKRTLVSSLKSRHLAANDIGPLLDAARRDSPARANQLASAIVAQRRRVGEERDAVRNLVRWANVRTADAEERRRSVVRAFRTNKRGIFVVHGIAELPAEDASLFMKSYFAEGGDIQPVMEWLEVAGRVMTRRQAPPQSDIVTAGLAQPRIPAIDTRVAPRRKTAGFLDWVSDAADAVGDWLSDAGDAIVDAVSSVVTAVIAAGMSLANAIAAIASWTVAKITDVLRALLAAGRSVATILAEALSKSVLKKFVEALIRAGSSLGQILAWAVQKAAGVIRDAVLGLLAAGRSIFQILSWAATATAILAQKVIRALIDAGRTVAQIMADVVRFSATLVLKLVGVLYAVVGAVGTILAAVAQTALSVIRTVVQGLLMIGVTLARLVAAICIDVVQAFRRGFFQGLIALGKTPLELLQAALLTSASVLTLAFAVLMEVFGGHRGLTAAERAEARRVFGWSIDLDRVKIAVASIPADVVNFLNGQRPFTTMYVINFASWAHVTMPTLMHELTHVWQGVVAGPVYMVEALHSQFFGRGYNVTDAEIAAAAGDLSKLEREQQAVVVERYWSSRWGGSTAYDWHVYEPLANDVYRPQPRVLIPDTTLLPRMLPLTRRVTRVPRLSLSVVG